MVRPTTRILPEDCDRGDRGLIRQASTIAYRRKRDRVSICLVTSTRKKHWILPKGRVEPGESAVDSALKEAYEEAGLRGRIVGGPIGRYVISKWGSRAEVTVLLMEVTDWSDCWAESHFRKRRWVSPRKAAALLKKPVLKELIIAAVSQLPDGPAS